MYLSDENACGLFIGHPGRHQDRYQAAPILQVSVTGKVVDLYTETTTEQYYVNNTSSDVSCVYTFPLNSSSAVCGFEVEIDGKVTKGRVKEKHAAKAEFDTTVARGGSAQLCEQESNDVFQMQIGNLRAKQVAIIRLKTVATLRVTNDAVEVFVPTFVAPRYDNTHQPALKGVLGKQTHTPLTIAFTCEMATPVQTVVSPTHAIRTTIDPQDTRKATFTLEGCNHLDKDFVVRLATTEPSQPRLIIEESPTMAGSRVAVLSLAPKLVFQDVKCEFVFVVDRSGSMSGQGMRHATAALALFLRSLPADCYFNIVGFGSSFEQLFPVARKNSNSALQKATDHVHSMQADLGGTEILRPLQAVMSAKPIAGGYARQVFLLTDGEVRNTEEIARTVKQHSTRARVFALGLGHGASRDLVNSIARAGRGSADFIVGEGLERAVVQQLDKSMQPSLTDTKLEFEYAPANTFPFSTATAAAATATTVAESTESTEAPPAYTSTDTDTTCYCDAKHAMALSTNTSGGYSGGWVCDSCDTTNNKYTARYWCKPCGTDFCATCAATRIELSATGTSTHNASVGSLLSYTSPGANTPASIAGTPKQAPHLVPPVFSGERLAVFTLFDTPESRRAGSIAAVTVTCQTPDGPLSVRLPVSIHQRGNLLHTLAGRALIQDLQDETSYLHDARGNSQGASAKEETTRLGLAYGLVSKHTSYIATQPIGSESDDDDDCFGAPQLKSRSAGSRGGFGGGSTGSTGSTKQLYKSKKKSGFGMIQKMKSAMSFGSRPSSSGYQTKSCARSAPTPRCKARGGQTRSSRCSASRSASPHAPQGRMSAPTWSPQGSKSAGSPQPEYTKLAQPAPPICRSMSLASQAYAPPPPQVQAMCFSATRGGHASSSSSGEEMGEDGNADMPEWKFTTSTSTPTRTPTRTSGDALQNLVHCQNFDGSFVLDDALAKAVGKTLADLASAADGLAAGLVQVCTQAEVRAWFASNVALTFLRTVLSGRKDEWMLVERKTVQWLRNSMAKLSTSDRAPVGQAATLIFAY